MIDNIAKLFVSHALGDYALQSQFIAEGKARSWRLMLMHCLLYLAPFLLWFDPLSWRHLIVFLSHFLIDTLKARYHRISFAMDQALHLAILAIFLM